MPIQQFLRANHAFDPQAVKAMTAAFEAILHELTLLDHFDPLTEIVAKKIIEAARLGVHNPTRLRELVVKSLSEDQIRYRESRAVRCNVA